MERLIRLIAGAFILASLALGYWVSHRFFLFPAFVGANLFRSALTKWCLMEDILAKFGYKRRGQEKEDLQRGAQRPRSSWHVSPAIPAAAVSPLLLPCPS
jgi:hypothetical protein